MALMKLHHNMPDAEFRRVVVNALKDMGDWRTGAEAIIVANRCTDEPLQEAIIAVGDAMRDTTLRAAVIAIGHEFAKEETRREIVAVAEDRIRARERREWFEGIRRNVTTWGATGVLVCGIGGALWGLFRFAVISAGGGQ